jgi:hypothetical protein
MPEVEGSPYLAAPCLPDDFIGCDDSRGTAPLRGESKIAVK